LHNTWRNLVRTQPRPKSTTDRRQGSPPRVSAACMRGDSRQFFVVAAA
jgi:hypothetical protein